MASRKNSTHTPKAIDPRALEALETRDTYISMAIEHQESLKKPMAYPECDTCEDRFKCFTKRAGYKNEEVTKGTGKCLNGWKHSILKEIPYVDIKQYSHNIISLALGAIARGWGKPVANAVIDEFGLSLLGWHKEK
jgi:hypothetical protein